MKDFIQEVPDCADNLNMSSSPFQEFLSVSARKGKLLHVPDPGDPASVAKAAKNERWLLKRRQDFYGAYLMLAVAWDYSVLLNPWISADYSFDEVIDMLEVRDTYTRVRALWERRVQQSCHALWELEEAGNEMSRSWREADAAMFWTAPGIDQMGCLQVKW